MFSAPFVNLGIKNPGIDNQLVYSNNLKQRNTIARSTGTASAEYLPRNAIYNYRYLKDRSTDPIILEGKRAIEKTEKNGSHISFKLQAASRTTIELPYIYYPGYSVKADGQTISAFETENGLVGIELEKGNYQITSHYHGSGLMIFAYVTSILSSILFILIVKKEGKSPSLQ